MRALRKEYHAAFVTWLMGGDFDYFVTLTSPSKLMSRRTARKRLREWLARMNRRLLGNRWLEYPDEHLFAFAALEKPDINAHWHLLIRICASENEPEGAEARRTKQIARFEEHAERLWLELVPSGTVNIQQNFDRGAAKYVAKDLWRAVEYEEFVTPDEFRNR